MDKTDYTRQKRTWVRLIHSTKAHVNKTNYTRQKSHVNKTNYTRQKAQVNKTNYTRQKAHVNTTNYTRQKAHVNKSRQADRKEGRKEERKTKIILHFIRDYSLPRMAFILMGLSSSRPRAPFTFDAAISSRMKSASNRFRDSLAGLDPEDSAR